jgi:hypothetical protein
MPLGVSFDPAANVSEVSKDGVTRPIVSVEIRTELPPGDIRVFTWNAKGGGR